MNNPTEAMIEAGQASYANTNGGEGIYDTGLAAIYLAMKTLDPDFATRADSQSSDAANARRINLMAAWFADNYSEDREWEDILHEAFAALPPSQSDNGEV